jgi:superkiller protein 3
MSGTKAALKGINDAIRQQKFDDAVSKARDLVEKDSKNYQA